MVAIAGSDQFAKLGLVFGRYRYDVEHELDGALVETVVLGLRSG
jgi:hypothetical protein